MLFANPYDMSAIGFYFDNVETYKDKAAKLKNAYGDPVEEFEIEFIDGEAIDAALAKAWELYQSTIHEFLEACEKWEDHEKIRFIIAVGECGYSFEYGKDDIDLLDVDIYGCATLRELAEQFIDDGLFGDIPPHLENYIDIDAMAHDLSFDYTQTEIAGESFVYRCG